MKDRNLLFPAALGLTILLASPAWADREDIYVSASGAGTAGGVSFEDEDIILCDRSGGPGNCAWSMFFDGSGEGIGKAVDLTAFHVLDDDNILMAFQTPKKVGNLKKVDDSDIVHFDRTATPGNAYTFHFDGSDVGLTEDDESIDALGFDPLGRLVISTDGDFSVPQTGGGVLTGGDADLIVFNGTTGPNTSGDWELYFDGSGIGLNSPQEDVGGLWIDDNTDELYLTTRGTVSAGSFSGDGTDIFVCAPSSSDPIASCASILGFFMASAEGFEDKIIDGLYIFNNDPPVAQDDDFNMLEDGILNGNVLVDNGNGADSDPDGDALTVNTTPVSGPSDGLLTLLANGNFTYTPSADYYGTDMFEYEIDDGNGGTDTGKVTIVVTPVNDEPSFAKGPDETVLEDAGAQSVPGWATGISAGPPNESDQTLTFNVTNNTNPALFAAGPSISAGGELSYTPADDANGSADITIELMDDGGTANGGDDTSPAQTFTINVTAVNDAPSFTRGADETVLENAGPQTVPGWATGISAGPADEAGQTLTFNVTGNTDPALFSAGPSVNAAGDLTYTPATDANGSADITIELMDDGGTANGGVDTSPPQVFTINVTPVNAEPSFTKGPDQTVLEDAGAQTVPGWATGISAGPNESDQTLTFNVTNNTNPALFAAGPSISADGELNYTPADNANGSADLTIELMDDGGTDNGGDDTSPPQTFTINVTAVNDEPSFNKGANPNVLEDAGAQTLPGWATGVSAGPADESGQTLTFNVTGNSNPALFAAGPSVNAAGDLSFTPAADAHGSADITILLMDDGGTADGGDDTSPEQVFSIEVASVNDAPSFTKGADQTVQHDAGPQTVDPWATGISVGPANESGQTPSFIVTNNNDPSLFAVQPAVSPGGVLTYTPQLDAQGTATITLVLMDDGGTANGGVDTSPPQMFDITVNVALPPVANDDTFASTGNVGIDLSTIAGALFADNGNGVDDDGGGTIVVSQVQSSDLNVGVATATSMGGTVTANADGSFSYTPAAGYTGADTFTYTITNVAGSSQATVTINVGNMIWFIDNGAGPGDGRLNSPFNTLAAFEAVNGNGGANDPAAFDCIFVHSGSGDYTAPVTLENNQVLVGQGAGDTIDSVCGITLPAHSNTLPTTGGSRPVITSVTTGVELASTNTVRGLTIGNTFGAGLFGAGVGASTVSEVDINGAGAGVNITTGTLAMSFDEISSSDAAGISLSNVSGDFDVTTGTINSGSAMAVSIAGNPVDLGVTLTSVSADGAANGINISNTTGSFTVSSDGSTGDLGGNDSGGIIQNTSGDGVVISTSENISLQNMTIGDPAVDADDADYAAANVAGDGIMATSVTGLTLSNVTIARTGGHGLNANLLADLVVTDSLVLNAGDGNEEHGFNLDEQRGDNFVIDSFFDGFNETGIELINASGTVDLTIENTTFQDNKATNGNYGEEAVLIEAQGTASIVVLVTGDADLGTTNSIFDDLESQGIQAVSLGTGSDIQLTVENSRFEESNSGDAIIIMNPDNSGNGNLTVANNLFTDDTFGPFAVLAKNDSSGTLDATIDGNTATNMQLLSVNHDNIGSGGAANGTSRILVNNNTANVGSNNIAVDVIATETGPVGTDPDLSLTITNNVSTQPDGNFTFASGLRIDAQQNSRLNADISGNDFQGDPTCCGGAGIELRELDSGEIGLEGFGGGNAAAAQTYIDTANPLSADVSFVTSVDANIDSGAADAPGTTIRPIP